MKKRYYNSETKEWYTGGSITRMVDGALFSGVPSEELLRRMGFEPWVEPAPTPEELLERAKSSKVAEIEAYDQSDEVNGFDIAVGGQTMAAWLTPDKRSDYKNSLDSAELLGMAEVHPVFNGVALTIPIQTAKIALAKIQIYANQCYGVTEQHKANVMALTTIEEVEAYQYESGYPERLRFEI